jgi:hypothetical protein
MRTTATASGSMRRVSPSPRVTIALILDADSDLAGSLMRLSARCERLGADGIAVIASGLSPDDFTVGRRVRVVSAPADASLADLRHFAMQHADADIVILEDREASGDRVRTSTPMSAWRAILRAHGVAEASLPSMSSPGIVHRDTRVDVRPAREPFPVMIDAHHRA